MRVTARHLLGRQVDRDTGSGIKIADGVEALATAQDVGGCATVEQVVAVTAHERVVALAAIKLVRTTAAAKLVRGLISHKEVVSGSADGVLDERPCVALDQQGIGKVAPCEMRGAAAAVEVGELCAGKGGPPAGGEVDDEIGRIV